MSSNHIQRSRYLTISTPLLFYITFILHAPSTDSWIRHLCCCQNKELFCRSVAARNTAGEDRPGISRTAHRIAVAGRNNLRHFTNSVQMRNGIPSFRKHVRFAVNINAFGVVFAIGADLCTSLTRQRSAVILITGTTSHAIVAVLVASSNDNSFCMDGSVHPGGRNGYRRIC